MFTAARTDPARAAALPLGALPALPEAYLGPGRVLDVHEGSVRAQLVRAPEQTVEARLALAHPYRPVPGDELLLIGGADGFYVIGVLAGHGQTELTYPGDVRLRAAGGTLELSGDRGLKLESPSVTIAAGEVKTFAREVTEKVDTAYRWVRGLLTVRAGTAHKVVEGEDVSRSKTSVTLAEGVVKIDGSSVQLGH